MPRSRSTSPRSVALMQLKYVVLTSVDRDDLPDGGAAHYAACVRAIKQRNPHTAVEALTPDFQGVLADVDTVVDSGLEVFAQNIETVRRLTHPVRDPRAGYEQTLAVLAHAKRHRPARAHQDQPDARPRRDAMRRSRSAWTTCARVGVDILTLGPVPAADGESSAACERFVTPEEFDRYRAGALARGFLECVAGPLVRSSYRAEQALAGNNAGLDKPVAGRRAPERARWPARDCAASAARASRPARSACRGPPARPRAVRADLARDAALYRRARRRHGR